MAIFIQNDIATSTFSRPAFMLTLVDFGDFLTPALKGLWNHCHNLSGILSQLFEEAWVGQALAKSLGFFFFEFFGKVLLTPNILAHGWKPLRKARAEKEWTAGKRLSHICQVVLLNVGGLTKARQEAWRLHNRAFSLQNRGLGPSKSRPEGSQIKAEELPNRARGPPRRHF